MGPHQKIKLYGADALAGGWGGWEFVEYQEQSIECWTHVYYTYTIVTHDRVFKSELSYNVNLTQWLNMLFGSPGFNPSQVMWPIL